MLNFSTPKRKLFYASGFTLMVSQFHVAQSVSDAKQVIAVVTDGFRGIGPEYIKKRTDQIKARGIEMFAIGTTKKINDEELTALSNKPLKNHLFRLTDNKEVKR